jgi:uncharacterized protein YfiM (DUF2279 family)
MIGFLIPVPRDIWLTNDPASHLSQQLSLAAAGQLKESTKNLFKYTPEVM